MRRSLSGQKWGDETPLPAFISERPTVAAQTVRDVVYVSGDTFAHARRPVVAR